MELDRSDIEQILKLIDEASFDLIQIEWKGLKILLKRGPDGAFDPAELAEVLPPAAAAASEVAAPAKSTLNNDVPAAREPELDSAPTGSSTEADDFGDGVAVKSPTVGMFYRRPDPSAPPFAEEGARVEQGDTLCLIEVMKLFTAITAEVSGKIERVLVEDGAMVEFDQTLMLITPDDRS